MSMSKDAFLDYQERFLGRSVGVMIKVLGQTACMNLDFRKILVVLDHYPKIVGFMKKNPDAKPEKLIQEVFKPFLKDLGHATWKRDILTDLAFALAQESNQMIDLTVEKDVKP